MTLSFCKPVLKTVKTIAACGAAALMLNGCGSGNGSSQEVQVAPASLEGVRMEMYGGFTLEFARLAGQNGVENGAVDYTQLNDTFRVGVVDPTNPNNTSSLGRDVIIPFLLEQVTYQYVRTSANTGLITLGWVNNQLYPHSPATMSNPQVAEANLFWGGFFGDQTSLTMEVLFVDAGGVINDTTVRLSNITYYTSILGVGTTIESLDLDSTTVDISLNGGRLLTGYDPQFNPDEPSSVVWPNLQQRSIVFEDAFMNETRVAYQSSGAPVLEIAGEDFVDDAGILLVNVPSQTLQSPAGDFSYVRTGGNEAKLSIRYNQLVGGVVTPTRVDYTLTFTNFEGGTYTTPGGGSGTFIEDLFTNQP